MVNPMIPAPMMTTSKEREDWDLRVSRLGAVVAWSGTWDRNLRVRLAEAEEVDRLTLFTGWSGRR